MTAREPVNLGAGFDIRRRSCRDDQGKCRFLTASLFMIRQSLTASSRRSLDTSRAEKEFGFMAEVPFREGLREDGEVVR